MNTMAEDINNLKIEVAVINNKLDNLASKQDEVLDMLKQHILEEEGRYKAIMDSKADKWTEKVLIWIGSAIGVILIGALMSLIIIK